MQCPNCYTETPNSLPRCVKCEAPLPRRSPPPASYDSPYERPHQRPHDPPHNLPYDPYEMRPAGGSGFEDGYGDLENWEPAAEWHPEWPPPEREPTRRGAARHGSRETGPWQAERDRKPRNRLLVTVIGAVVLGGAVAVGIVIWPAADRTATTPDSAASAADSGQAPGSPDAAAHAQAVAINDLLDEMAATHGTLIPAIADAARCDRLDSAVDRLDRVKAARQDQLAKAKALKVDALPDGDELRETLTRAAGYSLDADKAFLTWAKANRGCTDDNTPRDDDFDRAHRLSTGHARPEKENFVEIWNPIARNQGLPTRSARKL